MLRTTLVISLVATSLVATAASRKPSTTAPLPGTVRTVDAAAAAQLAQSELALPKSVISGLMLHIDHPSAPPRLVFGEADLMQRARITAWPSGYAVSVRTAQRTYVLHASGAAIRVPSAAGSAGAMPDPKTPSISRSHAIVTFDVLIAGAAVTLDIECRVGPKDPACAEDQIGLQMLAGLKRWQP
jgi:hypothetical protein